MGDQGSEEPLNALMSNMNQSSGPDGPTSESLELMESIIQRLQPSDRHDIREMISFRGLVSGALASMTAVFWWISVDKGGLFTWRCRYPNISDWGIHLQRNKYHYPFFSSNGYFHNVSGKGDRKCYSK